MDFQDYATDLLTNTGIIKYISLSIGSEQIIYTFGGLSIGLVVLVILYSLHIHLWTQPASLNRLAILIGSAAMFLIIVYVSYGLPATERTDTRIFLIIGVGVIVIGWGVGFVTDGRVSSGSIHGLLATGLAGILVTLIASQRSFSMQPNLTMIVIISGIISPFVLGILGSVSGAVGALSRQFVDQL